MKAEVERPLLLRTSKLKTRCYFVASELKRRWPELGHETAWIAMDEVPGTRWAPLENIWIVSTYLRLRGAGHDVYIADRPVPGAINIVCDSRVVRRPMDPRCFLVTTEGDRSQLAWGDYHLVQSPEQLEGPNCTLIGHWPQPGLLARDLARSNRVQRLGYVGPMENLAKQFRAASFARDLAQLGVEFVTRDDPTRWHDFSDLDLYLAVRDWPWHLIRTKPATKLVHAWLTGVPGLLGPEPSYRYWGMNGDDYFEICTPADALKVVRRLQSDPQLYEAVRQRGFAKARQHDEEAVMQQWLEILGGPVQEAFDYWQSAGAATWRYRAWRRRWQRIAAPLQQKLFTARSRGFRAVSRRLCSAERK